jgi:glucose/arabinose dehydrogenase
VIAPGDMLIYSGDMFKDLKGHALMAGLGSQALVDVALDGESAREVTRWGFEKRLRSLAQGPDGAIWVAEDGKGARLLKLTAR